MATRNEFGNICLDTEETRNFMDKMIHPDEEAEMLLFIEFPYFDETSYVLTNIPNIFSCFMSSGLYCYILDVCHGE